MNLYLLMSGIMDVFGSVQSELDYWDFEKAVNECRELHRGKKILIDDVVNYIQEKYDPKAYSQAVNMVDLNGSEPQ